MPAHIALHRAVHGGPCLDVRRSFVAHSGMSRLACSLAAAVGAQRNGTSPPRKLLVAFAALLPLQRQVAANLKRSDFIWIAPTPMGLRKGQESYVYEGSPLAAL